MKNLEPISLSESKRLKQLESTIEEGQEAWLAVGLALCEIRDSKLYRSDFDTFKEYCEQTWKWSDKRAYQLIAAAVESSTSGRSFPTERAARKAISSRKAICDAPPLDPPPVVDVQAQVEEAKRVLAPACHEMNEPEAPASERQVTLYYIKLENLVAEAIDQATDKQLVSMGVMAAQIPKMIKAELARRNAK